MKERKEELPSVKPMHIFILINITITEMKLNNSFFGDYVAWP